MLKTVTIEHEGRSYTGTYFVHRDGNMITVAYDSIKDDSFLNGMPEQAYAASSPDEAQRDPGSEGHG